MVISSTLSSVLSANSIPKLTSQPYQIRVRVSSNKYPDHHRPLHLNLNRKLNTTRLNAAGLSEIEPDLIEEAHDRWRTNGVEEEDFIYGEYDQHHTYHEEPETSTFWETVASEYAAAEPPTGFQAIISWLFMPAVFAGVYFDVPGEYLYGGAALFTVVFCIIEMDKPDKPHNFEPQIYNMERGSRDKLIADYNTMDIWDFNEKYGELWDFTIERDNLKDFV